MCQRFLAVFFGGGVIAVAAAIVDRRGSVRQPVSWPVKPLPVRLSAPTAAAAATSTSICPIDRW